MIDLTRYAETLKGKPVAVYGLGLSGLATVRALVAAEARVYAWDDDEAKRIEAVKIGSEIDMLENLGGFAALVLSPGVPLHFPKPHPVVERARRDGVEIIGDVELLHRARLGKKTIGITGTNGKSTTTALIGHILKSSGVNVAVGGNIGTAVLELEAADIFLMELSSFQLDLCTSFAPDIAVHISLTPDHLDRHGDMDGYAAAKMRIFNGPGRAVIGIDDEPSRRMAAQVVDEGERDIYTVSVIGSVDKGVDVEDGILYDAMTGEAEEIVDLKAFSNLPGVHNHQNAAVAYAVARLVGLPSGSIVGAMKSYPGLPHRLFTVRTISGVPYINDSKATNADAAGKALASYAHIHWIVGGKPKDGGLSGLENLLPHVKQAYVIGEAAESFSAWLIAHRVMVENCGTLEKAVEAAHRNAQSDGQGVVLLSPACASYDQFKSFEHRGEVFTGLVKGLEE
ncbi:MAG: UDP-N-acetylmuramoylalanine--D-glutamate ligase [Micavibrio sp.]|nr:UDP-N-acetylmuramoylalanine--D-glutamate ligase [Micavibrio sp.]